MPTLIGGTVCSGFIAYDVCDFLGSPKAQHQTKRRKILNCENAGGQREATCSQEIGTASWAGHPDLIPAVNLLMQ